MAAHQKECKETIPAQATALSPLNNHAVEVNSSWPDGIFQIKSASPAASAAAEGGQAEAQSCKN